MHKLKLMTIVGTRPELIRLCEVIKACDRYFDHLLVHTGQNWNDRLNKIFFEELDIRPPDYDFSDDGAREYVNSHVAKVIGDMITKSYELMERERPDAVLVLGDTNSALCTISAKRLKIPIFHMEAGNRCFDQNVPEETNRKIVDHIADVNLAYTEHSRRNLLAEGLPAQYVFVTGSPLAEVIGNHQHQIQSSQVLSEWKLTPGEYFVLSAHREETIEREHDFFALMNAMNGIAKVYELPIIYSVHPRSRKVLEKRRFQFHPLVRQAEPFGFTAYNKLQQNAYCVLSDSGTLSEESAMLQFPAVLIRTTTERPEVLESGTMVIGGIHTEQILQAIELTVSMTKNNEPPVPVADYQHQNVSVKVVKMIQSYTKIVNQRIWNKCEPMP